MKVVNLAVAILFAFVSVKSQVNPDRNSRVGFDQVSLTVKVAGRTENKVTLEFVLTNDGPTPILVSTDPVQSNGQHAYYVSTDGAGTPIVNVESRVFAPVAYSPYQNQTSVELVKIGKGESNRQTVTLAWPLFETVPPVQGNYRTKKNESIRDVYKLRIRIGYFVEEQGILALLARKPFGWYVNGLEEVVSFDNGRRQLYAQQILVSADISITDH
jgi:hypothetical protein